MADLRGRDIAETCRRVMDFIMTNELVACYTISGKGHEKIVWQYTESVLNGFVHMFIIIPKLLSFFPLVLWWESTNQTLILFFIQVRLREMPF